MLVVRKMVMAHEHERNKHGLRNAFIHGSRHHYTLAAVHALYQPQRNISRRRPTTIDDVGTCSSLLRPTNALELLCRLLFQIQLSMTRQL